MLHFVVHFGGDFAVEADGGLVIARAPNLSFLLAVGRGRSEPSHPGRHCLGALSSGAPALPAGALEAGRAELPFTRGIACQSVIWAVLRHAAGAWVALHSGSYCLAGLLGIGAVCSLAVAGGLAGPCFVATGAVLRWLQVVVGAVSLTFAWAAEAGRLGGDGRYMCAALSLPGAPEARDAGWARAGAGWCWLQLQYPVPAISCSLGLAVAALAGAVGGGPLRGMLPGCSCLATSHTDGVLRVLTAARLGAWVLSGVHVVRQRPMGHIALLA
mmetsp:Transcript_108438/g.336970  ORF Transcript_108438/g.336970 Transcript_108438/m.336970 type:complete len:271 (-) Transcript_108438:290-1102(-)